MFPHSHAEVQVQKLRHRELLADVARLRLVDQAVEHGTARRWMPVALAPLRFIATTLGRFGDLAHDSRETVRSKELELATLGVTWATEPAHERELVEELRAGLARRAAAPRYPTLAAIDRARDGALPRFATAVNAADLERRASELASEHWSESAWLTGQVSAAAFERVCAALESERIAAAGPPTPLVIAEIAAPAISPAAA